MRWGYRGAMNEGNDALAPPIVAVDDTLAAIAAAAGTAGFVVVERRPVQYGAQIVLQRAEEPPVPVTVYGGKGGVRVVVGGPPNAPARREIEALLASWSGPPVPDAPVLPPGPWLGSDEAGRGSRARAVCRAVCGGGAPSLRVQRPLRRGAATRREPQPSARGAARPRRGRRSNKREGRRARASGDRGSFRR